MLPVLSIFVLKRRVLAEQGDGFISRTQSTGSHSSFFAPLDACNGTFSRLHSSVPEHVLPAGEAPAQPPNCEHAYFDVGTHVPNPHTAAVQSFEYPVPEHSPDVNAPGWNETLWFEQQVIPSKGLSSLPSRYSVHVCRACFSVLAALRDSRWSLRQAERLRQHNNARIAALGQEARLWLQQRIPNS